MRWPLFRPTPLEDLLRRYSDFDRRPGRIPIVEVTGDETPLYICQHRHFLRTARHRVRAARVEAAAGRRVERAGHLAGEDDLLDAHARVERGIGVLKDGLDRLAVMPPFGGVEPLQIAPLEANGAAGRHFEPEHELCRRRLAAAGFADDPEGSSALDRERDPVDRAHDAALAAEDPAPGAEMLAEARRFENRHQAAPLRTKTSLAVECEAASQHRAVRFFSAVNSGGVSTRQRSNALAHRGAKAQPRGRAAKSGGWPSIAVSRWALSLMRGIELSSASV